MVCNMQCDEVKHIINQVLDRELPSEVLNDLSTHLDNCPSCKKHLEENLSLHNAIVSCKAEELDEEYYAELGDELQNCDIRISPWEMVLYNPRARMLVAVAAILVIALVSGFAIYHYGLLDGKSFSDKKFEAMMKKLPEGAVLMRNSSGEEVIFLDPALEADKTDDDLIRELNDAMRQDTTPSNEDMTFASTGK